VIGRRCAKSPADDPFVACFAKHRALIDHALALATRLEVTARPEAAELRRGGTSMYFSALAALTAKSERAAARAWLDCDAADRQLRRATCRALVAGNIASCHYDDLLAASIRAASARAEQLLRLRRQLRLLAVI
jgi:hypothetical protein